MKKSYYINDSKRRRIALYCSKKLLDLIRGISSKNNGDSYCLDFLDLLRTKNKLDSHKKVCEN